MLLLEYSVMMSIEQLYDLTTIMS